MTFIPFLKEYGKTTKAAIDKFEASVGMVLPIGYRKFLLKHNGGVFEEANMIVPQVGEEVSFEVFNGLGLMTQLDVASHYESLKAHLPEQTIPIGRDPGGNPFLIDLSRDDEPGSVYYWDIHRMLNKKTRKAIAYQLTKSFDDFLASLPMEGSASKG